MEMLNTFSLSLPNIDRKSLKFLSTKLKTYEFIASNLKNCYIFEDTTDISEELLNINLANTIDQKQIEINLLKNNLIKYKQELNNVECRIDFLIKTSHILFYSIKKLHNKQISNTMKLL